MSELDLGFILGIFATMGFAILIIILFYIFDWFSSVTYARNRIEELDEKIDFEKLAKDYSISKKRGNK